MLFTDVLGQYRRGMLARQATDVMNKLADAVRQTGKSGEVSITIKMIPDKNGTNEVTLRGSVKSKIPEVAIPDAIFFIGDNGELTRVDPNQHDMGFPEEGNVASIPQRSAEG